ncbi:hypothetical protein BDZ89DRAFT_1138066 [Hymenopellis radicata]|nr:hypothetical protein BDZ89DRAFT_1138066 [Hymenopellis radicata]
MPASSSTNPVQPNPQSQSQTQSQLQTATQQQPQMSFSTLLVPMPIPGTVGAPRYNGRFTDDFLDIVSSHGSNAGISNKDALVDYILRYSSDEVKEQLRFLPEFDKDEAGRTWDKAVEVLKELYGGRDQPKKYTVEEFKIFVHQCAAKAPFASEEAVTDYYRDFYDNFFVEGVPTSLKVWLHNLLPEAQRKKTSPPKVMAVVKLLKARFDSDSILYEEWKSKPAKDKELRFDDDGNRVTEEITPAPRPPTPGPSAKPQATSSQIEDLTEAMRKMQLSLAELKNEHQSDSRFTPATRRCWICGEYTNTHPPSPHRCPAMLPLIQEALVQMNGNRYTLPNGADLPMVPRNTVGGLAGYLRQQTAAPPTTRITPSQPSTSASTSNLGAYFDNGGQVLQLGRGIFGVATLTPHMSDPATRSQTKDNRYNPTQASDGKGKHREGTTPVIPPARVVKPPAPKPVNITPPPNPINREEGWKASQPSRDKPDVAMKDDTNSKAAKPPAWRFTSDIQENVDVKSVYQRVMDNQITISVKDLVGMSPALRQSVNDATKSRREYTNRAAEYSDFVEQVDTIYATKAEANNPFQGMTLECGADNVEEVEEFIRYHTSAIAVIDKPFFAMVTGIVNVKINGVSYRAMIDTGSELNITGQRIANKSGLALDFAGANWSLKGIHGDAERLLGCCLDAPLVIGSHDFTHHLFVSRMENIGTSYDLILGQPFLHYYTARINYSRTGEVQLLLWKNGDQSYAPTLSVIIASPEDPRNQTEIKTKHTHTSRIEEVPDEDNKDFY